MEVGGHFPLLTNRSHQECILPLELPQSPPDVNVNELLALRKMCTIVFSLCTEFYFVFKTETALRRQTAHLVPLPSVELISSRKWFLTMIATTFANQNFRLRVFLKLGY